MTKSKGWQPLTLQQQQQIVQRYLAGETLESLAAEYHRTRKTLRTLVLEAGAQIRPRGYGKNREWTPEWRAAHKRATGTPEFAQKSRENLLKRLPSMRGPATDTAIERRMWDALMKAGIGFATQSLLLERYRVDIEITQALIVIEADGAQHTLRDQKAKDTLRDAALEAAGYRVFRFTGSEINRSADECVQRVITACGLAPDKEPVYDIRTSFAGPSHPNWKGGKQEYVCEWCGEFFLAQPKHRAGKRTFCSRQCYGQSKVGVKLGPHSAEHRAKIGAANKRRHQIKVESDLTSRE